jgi:hypothetical protein
MSALTDLERAVLDLLLEGLDRTELRRQAHSVEVAGRRTTGVCGANDRTASGI